VNPIIAKLRVDAIRKVAADDEMAHSMEDKLYADVLQAIADGTAVAGSECARIVLTTRDISFTRWCA
jgi:hypothetical protein